MMMTEEIRCKYGEMPSICNLSSMDCQCILDESLNGNWLDELQKLTEKEYYEPVFTRIKNLEVKCDKQEKQIQWLQHTLTSIENKKIPSDIKSKRSKDIWDIPFDDET
jgi:tRNA nucleotidyltransferase/poly(A) polymerase